VLAWLGAGLGLAVLTLACGPTASPAEPSPAADAFAVVRATSQAAYQAGQTAMAQGDYLQACVDFDTAKTTDPDSSPEIQQALEQALTRCLTPPPPQSTSPPAAAAQRTLIVATLAAGVGTGLGGTPAAAGTFAPLPLNVATPAPAASPATGQTDATPGSAAATRPPSNIATPAPATTNSSGAPVPTARQSAANSANAALVTWNDPQGRFSISAPPDWTTNTQPQSLVGTGVVEFHAPGNQAEVDVAVDSSTQAVSPELYAAKLELSMQQQVAGYASEQVIPGTTAGSPSVQRVFTFTQKDATGQDHQARGMQVVLVKGSTPYIISASAPAELYQQFSSTFDQMVASFKFS
jgi:hypothetical protein